MCQSIFAQVAWTGPGSRAGTVETVTVAFDSQNLRGSRQMVKVCYVIGLRARVSTLGKVTSRVSEGRGKVARFGYLML